MTFHGEEFGFPVYGHGEVGIMLLLLLPFALLVPRTRSMALLAITAVVSYVAWWFTPFQILRHLLPTLVIAAAFQGLGWPVCGHVANSNAADPCNGCASRCHHWPHCRTFALYP